MTLQELIYFLELCETLHYTNAAKNLHISQPSLSYSIKQLEDHLGVSLFRKEGKNVYITEYGKEFKKYVESSISILKDGVSKIESMKNPESGTINLGYVYSIGTHILPKFIDSFHTYKNSTNISFILKIGNSPDLVQEVKKGNIDISFMPLLDDNINGISTFKVMRQELFLVVYKEHRLANKEYVTINDLKDEKLITLDKKSDLRKELFIYLKKKIYHLILLMM